MALPASVTGTFLVYVRMAAPSSATTPTEASLLRPHDSTDAAAYFHTDRLGSVRAGTDVAGTVTSAGTWELYGRPRTAWPEHSERPPLGWLGRYLDPTGIHGNTIFLGGRKNVG